MQITKFGHCCLLIEEKGVRILTDPGVYSTSQNEVKNIDLVIITHEHPDHFHLDSLKIVTQNNPAAKIITNKGVGALLDKEGISHEVVEDGQNYSFREDSVNLHGCIGNVFNKLKVFRLFFKKFHIAIGCSIHKDQLNVILF